MNFKGGFGRAAKLFPQSLVAPVAAVLFSCGVGTPHEEQVGSSASAVSTLGLDTYVLFAERSVDVGKASTVGGGAVGVRSIAPKSFGSQLKIGAGAVVGGVGGSCAPDQQLVAPTVLLEAGACAGSISANTVKDKGGAYTASGTFPAPPQSLLPLAPSSAGLGAINVPAATTTSLSPGSYGDLQVSGTAVLTTGRYWFSSITIGSKGTITTDAASVEVQVAGAMQTAGGNVIEPGLGLTAGNLEFTASGDIHIGHHSTVTALLMAPQATLSLGNKVVGTGAFAGFDVKVGSNTNVTFQDGIPDALGTFHAPQQLTGHITPEGLTGFISGVIPDSMFITLAVGLPLRNEAQLDVFNSQVTDPRSAYYRQWIQPYVFETDYAPLPPDYAQLTAWAASKGFATIATPSRMILTLRGTVAQARAAFNIKLDYRLRSDGTEYAMADREPSLDLPLQVLYISGLNNFTPIRPTTGGSGVGGAFTATDLRNAYMSCAPPMATGLGETVAIAAETRCPAGVLSSYAASNGILTGTGTPATAPELYVDIQGGNPAGDATITLEACEDIEMVRAMAPDATIQVYVLPPKHVIDGGDLGYTGGDIANMFARFADDLPVIDTISSSLLVPYDNDNNFPKFVKKMIAQGQAIFQSSGDLGGYKGQYSLSGVDPTLDGSHDGRALDGTTVVGGTVLTMKMSGKIYGSEVGWVSTDGVHQSGGGPVFPDFNNTSWMEYQANVANAQNKAPHNFRLLPDAAAVADNVLVATSVGGAPQEVEGTSSAAPIWAGFMASANQLSKHNGIPQIGFFNPLLYQMAADPVAYANFFNDIQSGSGTTDWPIVAGYDLATGWGSPKCDLVYQLASNNPLKSDTEYDALYLRVSTGSDNLRQDSGLTMDILDPANNPVARYVLKLTNENEWKNGFVLALSLPLSDGGGPSTVLSSGIGSVVLTIDQHPQAGETADKWNIDGFNLSLRSGDGYSSFCVADGVGTPWRELQSSPLTIPMGQDCPDTSKTTGPPPPGNAELTVYTGDDNLRDDSEVSVDLFTLGNSVPVGSQVIHLSGGGDWQQDTHLFTFTGLGGGFIDHMDVTLTEHNSGGETDDFWDLVAAHLTSYSSNGPENVCLVSAFGSLSSPTTRLGGSTLTKTFTSARCP